MSASVEYKGHILTSATRHRRKPDGWTLQVHVQPVGRSLGLRKCRAPNLYATEEEATERCLRFGRLIVDGKVQPRKKA
jgi:hypothetical protein